MVTTICFPQAFATAYLSGMEDVRPQFAVRCSRGAVGRSARTVQAEFNFEHDEGGIGRSCEEGARDTPRSRDAAHNDRVAGAHSPASKSQPGVFRSADGDAQINASDGARDELIEECDSRNIEVSLRPTLAAMMFAIWAQVGELGGHSYEVPATNHSDWEMASSSQSRC